MDPRRVLAEARAALAEAALEVPDGDTEAMKRVIAGAIKRRALPLSAKDWWVKDTGPRLRRASDRAPSASPAPAAPTAPRREPASGGPETNMRTGRTVPATNRFLQGVRSAPRPEPDDDDDDDRKWRGRSGDAEEFPRFAEPRPAAAHVGAPEDDRVLSWDFLGRPDDGGIEVPEPGRPGQVRTLRGTDAKPKPKGGSISRLFKRKPRDGRRELDRALKAADRPQGMLSRLIRGKDPGRAATGSAPSAPHRPDPEAQRRARAFADREDGR